MKPSIKVNLLATLLIGYQFTILGVERAHSLPDYLASKIKESKIDLPSKENLTASDVMKVVNQYQKINPRVIYNYSPDDIVQAAIEAITDTKISAIKNENEETITELAIETLIELERQTRPVDFNIKKEIDAIKKKNFERKENDQKLKKESYSYQINQTYDQLKENIENAYLTSQNQASELYNNPSFTSLGNTLTDPIIASGIAAGTLSLGYIYYLYTKYQAEQERLKQEAQENKDANL